MNNTLMDFFLRSGYEGPLYTPVNIGQVSLGRVVQKVAVVGDGTVITDIFGHIVGFARNSYNERILEVKWEDGTIEIIHPTLCIFCF